jgi:electron transfer flavoprotein alpha subunit
MGDILIICEQAGGEIKKYSKELAYKASELASGLGCNVQAIIFGGAAKEGAAILGEFGVSKVSVLTGDVFSDYNSDQCVQAAAKVVEDIKPSYVMATASLMGSEVLPRLAVRFDSAMASECIDSKTDGSQLVFRRPAYAGKAWIDLKLNCDIQFATVRPNVFDIGETKSDKAEVVTIDDANGESKIVLKERVQAEAKQVDLVEANVIVSGGRAMGSADNYGVLRELADLLNASIGASRAAVDAGYISHDHQVGQTGKTVNPTLYIACGISGAIQHLAGMRTSKIIVAINKDPEAPIFSKADFGIVGDLFKIIPFVTDKLKKLMNT